MRTTTTTTIALLLLAWMFQGRASWAQGGDCPCPCPPAADPGTASIGYFHQQLSPYGRWVRRDSYGEVWVPQVAVGWRPYSTGHWVYTDQGWAWVADESWGWAPFHYGRWYYDTGIGWAWVPGRVWAPAWVAWRHGGGYVGWAALPPAVGYSVGIGVSFAGVDLNVAIAPSYYAFVAEGAILTPRLSAVIVAPTRNVTIIQNTTNITNYSVVNNRIVNNGVNVGRIEQVTGQPVPRVRTASQVALYQPPVIARAARQAKAETFTSGGSHLGTSPLPVQSRSTAARSGALTGASATGTKGGSLATGAPGGRTRSTASSRRTTGTTGTSLTTGTTGGRTRSTSSSHTTGTRGTTGTFQATGAPGGHVRSTQRHTSHGTTGSAGAQTGATASHGSTGQPSGGRSATGHNTTGTGQPAHGQNRSSATPRPPKSPPPPNPHSKPPG
jgi:hypothetical protein